MENITKVSELVNNENETLEVLSEDNNEVLVVEDTDFSTGALMCEPTPDDSCTYQSLAIISLDEFYKYI